MTTIFPILPILLSFKDLFKGLSFIYSFELYFDSYIQQTFWLLFKIIGLVYKLIETFD